MRRVSVVGNSGAGKTHLARRIADVLGVQHIELDAIHHLPGWEAIDPDEFVAIVRPLAEQPSWVIDGNYRRVVVDGPVWERADTVVWVDLSRRTVMRQVVTRTLRRLVRREVLWNGNRERVRTLWALDPHESIIVWAFTQHRKYRDRYESAMNAPRFTHLHFVRLRSRADIDAWVDGLS